MVKCTGCAVGIKREGLQPGLGWGGARVLVTGGRGVGNDFLEKATNSVMLAVIMRQALC